MPPKKKPAAIKKPAVKAKKEVLPKAAIKKAAKAIRPSKPAAEIRIPHPEKIKEAALAPERYWEAVGRRKTAVARVRLFTRGEKGILVNGKALAEYFLYPYFQRIASEAVDLMKSSDRFRVTVKVNGGGLHAQAEALRHGTARALVLFNPDFRKRLKRAGFLTRDPRMKERKKFGLKGARKAPQWAKR